MDPRRLRSGDWIVSLSGALLLASLFLPWYRPSCTGGRGCSGHLTAWQALSGTDVVLALIGAAAVVLALVIASQPTPALPVALTSLVTLLGFVAAVLVLVRLLALPDAAAGRNYGVYLGLAAAVGITAAGWIALREERLSPPGRSTDATGRPAPPPPEIEPLPPPGPRPNAR
ncbi:MAG TPA: hypothetical protein VE780_17640 [Thermoleophilaceae bacterium]|nr:hypothetical protein [Thermoleophilaceae bacterium]